MRTFQVFTDSQRLLDRGQDFEMLKGKLVFAKLPLSWKKVLILALSSLKKQDIEQSVKKFKTW